jgi:hypothetical protein
LLGAGEEEIYLSDVNFAGRKRDEKKINGLYTRRLHQRDRKIERQTRFSCS